MARIAFDEFTLDTHRRLVFRKGVPLTASPKIVDLLELLTTRAGEVVSKDDIVRSVWRGDAVTDANIAQHVLLLRKLLDDERGGNRYIITVPKVGYRFAGSLAHAKYDADVSATKSEEAFRAYCHGQYLLQQKSVSAKTDALRWFEKSVRLDPSFARAHGGIANAAITLALHMCLEPKSSFALSRSAATTALSLEHGLADAHTALGDVSCFHERDWPAALASYERALAISPMSPPAHHSIAGYYLCAGQLNRCLAETEIALSLERPSLAIAADRALLLSWLGRHDEALDAFASVLLLEPDYSYARYFYASALFAVERYEEALNELLFVQSYRAHTLSLEGECNARLGRRPAAQSLLDELLAPRAHEYVSPYLLARLYVALDDHESALAMLQASLETGVAWASIALIEPVFAPLRKYRRYKAIETAIRRGTPPT
ncbi:MAG TPA: winged helix-turn-helix domain-containing protein [Candidatus Acidoferrales bacterium]|nr:winged helix-turn-helix domain-containing protein [Candidatus Acidoferrales bacterium]